MKIRSVEFVTSVVEPAQETPDDLPHVAFSGRSNVGKSSLINTLLRRPHAKIARVSSEPGKTRALNFYRVNGRFYLVDLPGYGYAKVPDRVRETWKDLIESYLERQEGLLGVVHLVDARHDPTGLDEQMIRYLARLELPTLVALTKMDKLSRSQRSGRVDTVADDLGVDPEQVVTFSATTGEGRDALLAALSSLVAAWADDEG